VSKCKNCSSEENIIYSGTDALLLGIPGAETETTCYPCANKKKEIPTSKRYSFGGFTFGSENLFQLIINIRNLSGEGTSRLTEIGFELEQNEIDELIQVLQTRNKKDKN
jgi:hypothetical protein